jgi:hypothetical protein
MVAPVNRQILLGSRPEGTPSLDNFTLNQRLGVGARTSRGWRHHGGRTVGEVVASWAPARSKARSRNSSQYLCAKPATRSRALVFAWAPAGAVELKVYQDALFIANARDARPRSEGGSTTDTHWHAPEQRGCRSIPKNVTVTFGLALYRVSRH